MNEQLHSQNNTTSPTQHPLTSPSPSTIPPPPHPLQLLLSPDLSLSGCDQAIEEEPPSDESISDTDTPLPEIEAVSLEVTSQTCQNFLSDLPPFPPIQPNPNIIRSHKFPLRLSRHHHTCAVCQETIHRRTAVIRLNCHHSFHPHCIQEWLTRKNSCPLCRREVKQPSPYSH